MSIFESVRVALGALNANKLRTILTMLGMIIGVCAVISGTIDNFIRPVLIRRGANLPLLLIFAGVIGGLVALGIIGLFVGPVVLTVTYTLLKAWVSGEEVPQSTAADSPVNVP